MKRLRGRGERGVMRCGGGGGVSCLRSFLTDTGCFLQSRIVAKLTQILSFPPKNLPILHRLHRHTKVMRTLSMNMKRTRDLYIVIYTHRVIDNSQFPDMLGRCGRIVSRTLSSLKVDAAPTAQEKKIKFFQIYRWDPEKSDQPHVASYPIDLNDCGPMVLDALLKIKNEQDSTLTFRRSCREGICGSCAMNIGAQIHCPSLASSCRRHKHPRLPRQNRRQDPKDKDFPPPAHVRHQGSRAGHDQLLQSIQVNQAVAPQRRGRQRSLPPLPHQPQPVGEGKETFQSREDRAKLDGLYECILCACCSTSCPSYWWNGDKYLGPAILLQVCQS
jgi:succinate dehydrogenase (ubiquinone) iron-sulfur subunit